VVDLPLDRQPSVPPLPMLATPFTLAELAGVRHEVEAFSRRCGLDGDQLDDWVTAVNELMINAIRHGGGRGTVRVFLQSRLTCEVTDHGRGFNTAQYVPRIARPPLAGTGGMGLWMVGRMADFLVVDSGAGGTTIRIAARTPQAARRGG
jgi:serine/threonine-protein kinase RsbW